MVAHVLEVDDLTKFECEKIVEFALRGQASSPALAGQSVALIFEKPSSRTRNSMEVAINQLGGHGVYIHGNEISFDVRETVEDITRVFMQYYGYICARVFDHKVLERMTTISEVPIINLLSDVSHPLQAFADMATIVGEFGENVSGKKLAYIGDSNNVARSLAVMCGYFGIECSFASPKGYEFSNDDKTFLEKFCPSNVYTTSPKEAALDAHIIYSDVWVSMGEEDQYDQKIKDFHGYTIDAEILSHAHPDAIFLHCLPAHRGEEVTAEVLEGTQSRIWPQAANRMHSSRALFEVLASK